MGAAVYYAAEADRWAELAAVEISAAAVSEVSAAVQRIFSTHNQVSVEVVRKRGTASELNPAGRGRWLIRLGEGASWLMLIHEVAHLDGVLARGWAAERHDETHAQTVDVWAHWVIRRFGNLLASDLAR